MNALITKEKEKNKYKSENLLYSELKASLEIPRFQRSLVWKKASKKRLIETIKNGFPFGSLLLYEKKEKNEYLLIDGLQRFSTIQDFERNPCSYIDLKIYAEEQFEKIFTLFNNNYGILNQAFKNQIIKFTIERYQEFINQDDTNFEIANALTNQFAINTKNPDVLTSINALMPIIGEITTIIKSFIDLSALKIPVITFYGDDADLPEIFENINSTGNKLSKYEVLASVWSNKNFIIKDDEILDKVEEKYINMNKNSEISVSGFQEGDIKKSKEINLFEYLCAIGKLIKEKCPESFNMSERKRSDVDSIGFTIISSCIQRDCKNIKNLDTIFENCDSKKMIALKNKIIECCIHVNNLLKKFVVLNNGDNVSKFYNYQMPVIVATIFNIKYRIDENLNMSDRPNQRIMKSRFDKNMPLRYLYDIIKGKWSKSADIENANKLLKSDINDNPYVTLISPENWRVSLEEWMHEQITVDSVLMRLNNKLFLNYLFKLNNKDNEKSFFVEYIISLESLRSNLGKGPFCAIGNHYIRFKYEQHHKNYNETELENNFYAERTELRFTEQRSTFTRDNYIKFIKDRHTYLISRFIKLIDNQN